MIKYRVNLYTPSLLPPKQKLTFARLGAYALSVLLLLVVCMSYSYWQVSSLRQELQLVTQKKQQLDTQKQTLEAELAARKADPALVERVDLVTQQLELKQLLMQELSLRASLTSRGFAPVLNDLAVVADGSVWLSHIVINEQDFMFEGFAEHPQSIPLWVDKLKTTHTLKGQAFSSMSMDRGEDKPLAFTLKSNSKEATQ
ncbi:fimbrial assembly protein [Shewanella morhuae]|uniref:fimbrial assembly protein n=1 Tax=Shewanella morhuae TaxID=365591 RepID=UPI001BC2660C|nr:fimbrial assembly protein [Shewanella morhuae]GIU12679.1 MSHA biogenesis protein MshI2 [Shewanella morhuae]